MNKVMNLLSVCRKAGKLVLGFDASKEAILKRKAVLVVLATDISPKTEKEIRFFADKTGVTMMKTDAGLDDFAYGLGKRAAIAAVCDSGFAAKLIELGVS